MGISLKTVLLCVLKDVLCIRTDCTVKDCTSRCSGFISSSMQCTLFLPFPREVNQRGLRGEECLVANWDSGVSLLHREYKEDPSAVLDISKDIYEC